MANYLKMAKIIAIPNDWVFINKLQFLWLSTASLNQSFYCFKTKRAVCKGYLTCFIWS
ncbi:hypothetical protein ACFLZ8_06310 [Planctomycetota bacterium]